MEFGRIEVNQHPLVSIVTPSYNMAQYLEEAIQSVLTQDYPHIEYIVMDGGSTDGSLEILRKYEGRLRYVSEPDHGQTDAINKGFMQSHGQIFAFLCADDTYLPGAVSTAVRHMLESRGHAGIYGEGYLTDEAGVTLCRYPTKEFDPELLKTECFICQPASFLWREAYADAGMLNPEIHYGLDYDLWIRIAKKYSLRRVNEYLATSRMHRGSKTLRERTLTFKGNVEITKAHYGYVPYTHIYGYCASRLDKRDGFFEPIPSSLTKYAFSLVYGSLQNRRHLWRYWREWFERGSPRLSARLLGRSATRSGHS